MDKIFINELRLDILVGVYDWEKTVPQKVQFDLEIGLPARKSKETQLDDTIDYAVVVSRIEASLAGRHTGLLENLAEHVAQLILREFRPPWVKVSVAKLAPLAGVKRLGVTIERGTKP